LLNGKLKAAIECLLFVAEEPLPVPRLSEVLDVDEAEVAEALRVYCQRTHSVKFCLKDLRFHLLLLCYLD